MWFDNSKPDYMDVLQNGGLLDILYIGVKTSVYPCLIFLGVGAMTDFGPLLANPKSMLLGAAAQLWNLLRVPDCGVLLYRRGVCGYCHYRRRRPDLRLFT